MARKAFILGAAAPTAVLAWSLPFPHPNILKRADSAADGIEACNVTGENISRGVAAMPDFTTRTDEEVAAHLCCEDGIWDPTRFDEPLSKCVNYLMEYQPTLVREIEAYSNISGFCSTVGSVSCAAIPITTASITTVPTGPTTTIEDPGQITGSVYCSSASEMASVCFIAAPDDSVSQAGIVGECLCGDNDRYGPGYFDGYMGSCLAWASTGYAEYYTKNKKLDHYCSKAGFPAFESSTPIAAGGASTVTETTSLASTDALPGSSVLPDSVAITTVAISKPPTDAASSTITPISLYGGPLIVGLIACALGFY